MFNVDLFGDIPHRFVSSFLVSSYRGVLCCCAALCCALLSLLVLCACGINCTSLCKSVFKLGPLWPRLCIAHDAVGVSTYWIDFFNNCLCHQPRVKALTKMEYNNPNLSLRKFLVLQRRLTRWTNVSSEFGRTWCLAHLCGPSKDEDASSVECYMGARPLLS